jgi:ADP-heptose:LPS heptosyltransferase
MPSGPFPILFFAPADLTDAICASGVFKRLHDEIENASFTVVANPRTAPLFREAPKREATLSPERPGVAGALALWGKLRRRRWGLVLDAAGLKLAGAVPARQRARLAPDAAPAHKVVHAARLLRLEEDPPPPFIFTSGSTRQRGAALVGEGGPVLALAPAANWIGRAWPVERYARAAVRLLSEGPLAGGRLLIVGAPEDWKAADPLRRTLPKDRWIDLTREPDPLVVHACLSQARLFIGGAAPITHLAAAAGAPTLGLYGPDDEAVEGPWGPLARTVRGPRSPAAIRATDAHLDQPVCHMLDLSVEMVTAAALRLLDESAAPRQKQPHG